MKLSVDEAYEKYADRVFAAAFSVCRDQADAEDVVQDTYIRYQARKRDFENEEHIRAWLLRVAINRARDVISSFWRRNRVTWEAYMDELEFQEPEDHQLFDAVMRLPDRYRTVVHLFYYEDYSVRQIAELLGSSEGTVKSQLNRGRKLLKNMLMEEWNDDE